MLFGTHIFASVLMKPVFVFNQHDKFEVSVSSQRQKALSKGKALYMNLRGSFFIVMPILKKTCREADITWLLKNLRSLGAETATWSLRSVPPSHKNVTTTSFIAHITIINKKV
jgi:hypothetical protein